jgi:hypothetical protein
VTSRHGRQLRARTIGGMSDGPDDRKFIRQRNSAVTKEPQHVTSLVEWVRDKTGGDHGTYRMKLILKGSRDTEISTSAANGSEQIGFFIAACPYYLAFGSHEFGGSKVVEGEAILAHKPTKPTAQGEPSDPRA